MKIVIPGDPVAKARARFTKRGFAYDPQHEIKERVKEYTDYQLRKFYEKRENGKEVHKLSIDEAFEVDWYFYMPVPKSFSQLKKNACKWGLIEHTGKPDRSNLEKFYEDCANNILWKDDSQIVTGKVVKRYCENDNPRTEIYMKAIQKPDQEMTDIISLFSPDEVYSIVEDAKLLYVEQSENSNSKALPKIATFLSKIADQHATKFTKIHKKYPGYWKKNLN